MTAESPASPESVALYYHDDAYQPPGGGKLLMGRHVAGREFLDALLRFGTFTRLVGVSQNTATGRSLGERWQQLPAERRSGRELRLVTVDAFHRDFLPSPPAPVIHFPNPPDVRFAWARQAHGRPAFAFSGVTHTICSETTTRAICDFVAGPVEEYDCLVCTSRAVVKAVRAIADGFVAHLAERFGGQPRLRMRLEHIPLGVNTERFRPATADERTVSRGLIGATADEVVVLCTGRIAFHAKAHPFPLYAGLAEAARRTGKPVHLVLAGKAPNAAIEQAFRDGGAKFAPGVRLTLFDGTRPDFDHIWHAADVFALLSDNIQESFGQAITEAMACGLPVVTTDWDGCRDLVADGESGYLVSTYLPRDAARDATSRLILSELNYDHFLGACNQAVSVDVGKAAEAFAKLIGDAELRRRMGAAGRVRAVEQFAWAKVIRAYESLWAEQSRLLAEHAQRWKPPAFTFAGPACYPALDHSFAAFPSRVLSDTDQLEAAPPSVPLPVLLRHSLTNYFADQRITDEATLSALLARAASGATLAELDAFLADCGTDRNTVAWLLKYGLLRVVE